MGGKSFLPPPYTHTHKIEQKVQRFPSSCAYENLKKCPFTPQATDIFYKKPRRRGCTHDIWSAWINVMSTQVWKQVWNMSRLLCYGLQRLGSVPRLLIRFCRRRRRNVHNIIPSTNDRLSNWGNNKLCVCVCVCESNPKITYRCFVSFSQYYTLIWVL